MSSHDFTVAEEPLRAWRRDTPGCGYVAHLNNAGAALMPAAVSDAVAAHLRLESERGGYEAADLKRAEIATAYQSLGALVGALPRNIAIVENATVACSQAMSAFDFAPGDRIVATRNDYVANQLAYLALRRRFGVEVLYAAELTDGGADPDDVAYLVRQPRVRVATVTWMPTNSGLVQQVDAISAACRRAGVPLIVDACQVIGQRAIDVQRLGCDFLAATGRKFLRGPRGIGFLYVSDEMIARGAYPLALDAQGANWVAADDFELVSSARRFENWEFAYALVLGLGAAADYALRVGLDVIETRCRWLATLVREQLSALPGVSLLDRGADLSAIVSARIENRDCRDIMTQLRNRAVNTSAALREWALLDMDAKGVQTALRVSPHYYNTEDEVERFAAALLDILTSDR